MMRLIEPTLEDVFVGVVAERERAEAANSHAG